MCCKLCFGPGSAVSIYLWSAPTVIGPPIRSVEHGPTCLAGLHAKVISRNHIKHKTDTRGAVMDWWTFNEFPATFPTFTTQRTDIDNKIIQNLSHVSSCNFSRWLLWFLRLWRTCQPGKNAWHGLSFQYGPRFPFTISWLSRKTTLQTGISPSWNQIKFRMLLFSAKWLKRRKQQQIANWKQHSKIYTTTGFSTRS